MVITHLVQNIFQTDLFHLFHPQLLQLKEQGWIFYDDAGKFDHCGRNLEIWSSAY